MGARVVSLIPWGLANQKRGEGRHARGRKGETGEKLEKKKTGTEEKRKKGKNRQPLNLKKGGTSSPLGGGRESEKRKN